MTQMPQVSIVMCTYNGADFLEQQVNSVLGQDYPNFELIIVDDYSKDDTWNLLQKFQQASPAIKIYRNEINLGYNKNFEKAIQLAEGEFISLADQDDIWLSDKISKTLNAFVEEEVILAHCRSVRLEDGELKYHKANLHYQFNGNDTKKLFFFNQIMGHDMVFKKKLVQKIIPLPPGMSYDWWIAVMATCHGRVAAVDDYLVYHRIHKHNNFFNPVSPEKKKELDLDETLKLFSQIPGVDKEKRDYLETLIQLLAEHKNKKGFDVKLFRFLYGNRKIIFGHKRRFLREVSYLKNAIKYAAINYMGKGISI